VGIGCKRWVFVGIFHTYHYQFRNSQTNLHYALCENITAVVGVVRKLYTS